MNLNYHQKEIFWLRFAGWFCLGELIIIVLFAVYVLTTAKSNRWTDPKNMMRLLIFAIIFVAVIIAIPLYLAYRNCKKYNNKTVSVYFSAALI
ncbi:hypothetical protein BC335_2235 [Lactobacillus helveticus]|uniref:Uncharacterized protein n=1 Tax=Lactobacillus helveticus TaxID=1587 RepID=A0A386RHX2_LACHE|nr:hypothetical protein [Lactobacillus helveticus]AYE62579.1 hypothetical protein BC335_2235 [Lactobacillus helveticus]MCD9224516.1 hypothetical protein [Lactobacillus helveticus]